jgi:hypothetical protein
VNLNLFLSIFLGPISFLIRLKKKGKKKKSREKNPPVLPCDVPQVQL